MNIIKRIIHRLEYKYSIRNSERFCNYLRRHRIKVGEGCYALAPRTIQIDMSRPELLTIGNHVFLHRGTIIMTHDWASWCFVNSHNEFLPSHGRVNIGNNVWLGENVTICKGVQIGNNCIIGIGSVVTKSIPDNCVAAGVPAKVICSYDDYYEKRKRQYIEEAEDYVSAILDSGKEPSISDFYDDYPCFVDGENYAEYSYPYSRVFDDAHFLLWKKNHKKVYRNFDELIQKVKRYRHEQ